MIEPESQTHMAQVFTSYSRRDTETVDSIVEKLSQAGVSVWIDREAIKAGNTWRVQIVQAIDTSHAFLLMLSPNSAASDNVRKEIDLSQDSGRTIFAVMLEPTKIPAEIRYQLAGLQFIDVEKLGFDNAVEQLIETVKAHLAKFAPVPDPETRQAELVIQGIDLSAFTAEKQQQLLDFISQLTSANRSQLQIANLTAGSVHVFVDMPAQAAFQLKTRALNRDERFKRMGVISLKLDGDSKYVDTSTGALTASATTSPLAALWSKIPALFAPMVGVPVGQLLTILLGAVFIVGATITLSGLGPPAATPPSITDMPFDTPTPPLSLTATASQSPHSTITTTLTVAPTGTATPTQTATPSLTATETLTPAPVFSFLTAEVINRTACRHGPGDIYLYRFGLIPTNRMEIRGRVDLWNGKEMQTWLWGLPEFFPDMCWVNARDVKLGGEVSSLAVVYPDKVKLPITSNWQPPQNVTASRRGDNVIITWDRYLLPEGERESESTPLYVLELWLCQNRQLVLTALGTYAPFSSGDKPEVAGLDRQLVSDEAGCPDPSHGRIFLAEKHGYVGPVEIKWPPHTIPTP